MNMWGDVVGDGLDVGAVVKHGTGKQSQLVDRTTGGAAPWLRRPPNQVKSARKRYRGSQGDANRGRRVGHPLAMNYRQAGIRGQKDGIGKDNGRNEVG